MKKIVSMLCACVLSLSLFGCSKPENNVELKKNVSCQLLDVLTITNDTDNSTYYYYLASVENKGKKPYDTKNLIYTVTDDNEKDISVIDKYQSTPSYIINKGQNTYIYGYIGFPNNDQKTWVFLLTTRNSSCLLKPLIFVRLVIKMLTIQRIQNILSLRMIHFKLV